MAKNTVADDHDDAVSIASSSANIDELAEALSMMVTSSHNKLPVKHPDQEEDRGGRRGLASASAQQRTGGGPSPPAGKGRWRAADYAKNIRANLVEHLSATYGKTGVIFTPVGDGRVALTGIAEEPSGPAPAAGASAANPEPTAEQQKRTADLSELMCTVDPMLDEYGKARLNWAMKRALTES